MIVRLAPAARADVVAILSTSLDGWGSDGQARYAALLEAAIDSIRARPTGLLTRSRKDLHPDLRSFHTRHAGGRHGVASPVHVLYYRLVDPDHLEIVRILHERMEPSRHFPARRAPRRGLR